MKLEIKKEFVGRTKHVQNRLGTTVMFDGTRDYTQEQLLKMKNNIYFENFIQEKEEVIEVQDIVDDVVYIRTIKQTPKDEVVAPKDEVVAPKEDILEKAKKEVKKYTKKNTKK